MEKRRAQRHRRCFCWQILLETTREGDGGKSIFQQWPYKTLLGLAMYCTLFLAAKSSLCHRDVYKYMLVAVSIHFRRHK